MAFTDDDLATLAADFTSSPGGEILRPRATERIHGGNAGFSHFSRAAQSSPIELPRKKCRRCRETAEPNRTFCARHLEEKRRQQTARNRARGVTPWQQARRGRPPLIARPGIDQMVATQEALLADALIELAVITRTVTRLRAELTRARSAARKAVRA